MLQLAGPRRTLACDIIQEGESAFRGYDAKPAAFTDSPSFFGGSKIIWLKHFSGFSMEGESKGKSGVDASLKELAKRIQMDCQPILF